MREPDLRICLLGDGNFVPVVNLVRFLAAAGHHVQLITFDQPPSSALPAQLHRIPLRNKAALLLGRDRVRDLVASIGPDVVHAFYLTSYGFLASKLTDIPVLATATGTDVFGAPDLSRVMRPLRTYLSRVAIRGADRIHSVAAHMTERLVKLGAPPGAIETFPRGVSLERFDFAVPERPLATPPRLLCTRKLESVYDHETLLEGVASLRATGVDYRLDLVGKGPLEPALRRRAEQQDVVGRVHFRGFQPHSRLPGLLAEADLYLSASLSDGTSSSLLEALAVGVVPVVSDIPANRSWIEDGDNGFLFEPRNSRSFADAVRRALDCAERWSSIRRANRSRVESLGSIEDGHRRVLALYRQLLGGVGS